MPKLVDLMKTFKGKVTLSDIRNEFKKVVDTINDLITVINSLGDVSQYDLSKTSNSLSSPNYTLSLGGLKKILNEYYPQDTASWVVKPICVKLDSSNFKYFPGLLNVPNVGIVQTKQTVLNNCNQGDNVYFDIYTKELTLSTTDLLVDKITNNIDSSNYVVNSPVDVLSSNISMIPDEDLSVKVNPTKTYYYHYDAQAVNTSNGSIFYIPMCGSDINGGTININGVRIMSVQGGGSGGAKNWKVFSVYSPIWIPKGINNSITGTNIKSKVLNFRITKEET